MSQDRSWKLKFIYNDAPTTEELDLFKESRERIAMIIRSRWIILGILAAYGVIPYVVYQRYSIDLASITTVQWLFPVIAWCAMAVYNAFFQYSFHWFANLRPLNQIQLLLDLLFVTVVVHFSGGAVSWFWTMYLVVTLGSVLVMDKDSDTYAFALGGSLAYGGLLVFEFHGIVPPVSMPFENLALQRTLPYGFTKWAWVSMTNMGVAAIGVFLIRTIRTREDGLRKMVIKDHLTSLYNRGYFFYRLNSEIQRAKRYKRSLSLLVIDVDRFKQFNDRYGHLFGDRLLQTLSRAIVSNIRHGTGRPSYELDIPCRFGGDEFAVILPETNSAQAAVAAERLRVEINARCGREMREQIRESFEGQSPENVDVSVSIGVASCPEDASEMQELFKMADEAMYRAKRSPGNPAVVPAATPAAAPAGGIG